MADEETEGPRVQAICKLVLLDMTCVTIACHMWLEQTKKLEKLEKYAACSYALKSQVNFKTYFCPIYTFCEMLWIFLSITYTYIYMHI